MSVAAGWYPDPAEPLTQRYWDGEQWVGGAVPVGVEPPAVPPPSVLPSVPPSLVTPPPAAEVAAPPLEAIGPLPRLAAPLLRLLARLIDIGVVSALVAIVNSYFFYEYAQETLPQLQRFLATNDATQLVLSHRAARLLFVMTATAVALWFAYEVPATANTGQTLGKRIVGLRVQRLDGRNLTLWQSFRRWFVLALPAILLQSLGLPLQLVDCAWCTWDRPLLQCLHDKPVQSVVVRGGPNRSTPPPEL